MARNKWLAEASEKKSDMIWTTQKWRLTSGIWMTDSRERENSAIFCNNVCERVLEENREIHFIKVRFYKSFYIGL